jgi:hypothetical protein
MTNLQIRKNELCGEFWVDLREILDQAGGDPALIDVYMDAPLRSFVALVAPNGIRPIYKKEGHLLHDASSPE